jgi:hypothetical protein
MLSPRFQQFMKYLMLSGLLLFFAPEGLRATILRSSTHSGSVSVGPTSGLGVLNYTWVDQVITCSSGSFSLSSTYEVWSYNNFVYVDGSGASHTMSGSTAYFQSNGISPPCPGNGGSPVTLTGGDFTILFVPDKSGFGTATLQPISGHINPKYIVMAVTYAPPGAQSSANYGNSTLLGNSTTIADSSNFQSQISVSLKATTGAAPIIGLSGTTTYSYSQQWTEDQDTSSTISMNKTTAIAEAVSGPTSSLGLNHDYDVIWLWLNPLSQFDVLPGPNSVTWTGYAYDANDIPEMDVYPVYVGYLNGHFAMPSNVASVLARTWASVYQWGPNEGPGLTAQDFAAILATDPFSDPTYMVSVPVGSRTSSDGRFTVTGNQNVSYVPPPPGGNPTTQSYTESYESTDTAGQGSKHTLQVAWSLDQSISASFGPHFIASLTAETQYSRTQTWTHEWSTTRTNTSSQSASLSVTGPAATDNYTGPTEFVVYQDNIFGTFMFYPVTH